MAEEKKLLRLKAITMPTEKLQRKNWRVLVIDDDEEVHSVFSFKIRLTISTGVHAVIAPFQRLSGNRDLLMTDIPHPSVLSC